MLGQDWHVLDLILVQKGVSRCTSDDQVHVTLAAGPWQMPGGGGAHDTTVK